MFFKKRLAKFKGAASQINDLQSNAAPVKSTKRRVKKSGETSQLGGARYGEYSGTNPEIAKTLLPWNTEEGKKRLIESDCNDDFFLLAHVYAAQKNPFYCGAAAIVMTLNAMRLDKGRIPSQPEMHYHHYDFDKNEMVTFPYRLYHQNTLLDEETDRIKPRDQIAPKNFNETHSDEGFNPGMSLHEVCEVLRLYEASVDEYHIDESDPDGLDKFRYLMSQRLLNDDHLVIVNFDGHLIGLNAGGHFAVLGAFHRESDSLLVLDPAAHKTPWYWVPLKHLYDAMNTVDDYDATQRRGYLLVWDEPELV